MSTKESLSEVVELVWSLKVTRGRKLRGDHMVVLFSYTQRGYVRYEGQGQMICSGFHHRQAPDVNGQQRQAIILELVTLPDFENEQTAIAADAVEATLRNVSLQELRQRAISGSAEPRDAVERRPTPG
jgi:hypothetical protein